MRQKIMRAILIPVMMLSLLVLGSADTTYAGSDYGLSNPTSKAIIQSDAYELDENNYKEQPDLETKWDCVWFGSYPQSDSTGEYYEPIKWRVLSVDGDDAFLLADKILDSSSYNTTSTEVTWETCSLRSWLNNEFYNAAFTSAEQAAIRTTTVVNEDNPIYAGVTGGNDTQDKVYLMSISEFSNPVYGFPNDLDTYDDYRIYSRTRWAYVTKYAEEKGVYASKSSVGAGTGATWLRSPGNQNRNASMVGSQGYLNSGGWGVYHAEIGVRPALHIDLSSDAWSYAGTVTSEGVVDETAPLIPPSEEIVLGDMEVELQQGYSVIPMYGMDIYRFRKNLKVAEPNDIPFRSFAIWTWGVWDDKTNQYLEAGGNNSVGDTFDINKRYRAELQVVINYPDEYTTYSFDDDATIRIGDCVFTLHKTSTLDNCVFGYFYSEDISARYITVQDVIVNEGNMNDVLGDKDEGSTVTYDNTNNVLRLNNAHLSNDSEDIMHECISSHQDLDIELIGKNSITFNSKLDTTADQSRTPRNAIYLPRGTLNIYGTGSLDFTMEADRDGEGVPFDTYGIMCNNFNLKDAGLSFTAHNCRYGKAVYTFRDVCLTGDAGITVDESGDGDLGNGFLGIEACNNFYAKDNSRVIINTKSEESAGMLALYTGKLSENSMLYINAPQAFFTEEEGEEDYYDVAFDSNHKYGTALVSTEPDGSNRFVWPGTPKLGDGGYTLVQVPAPVYTPAAEPTATEAGNKEYYYDPIFNKYYSDALGNKELSESEVIIPPTDPVGPTPEDPDDPKPVDPTPTPVPVVTPTAPTEPAEMIILSALKISKPAPAKKAVTVKWKKVSKKNQKKIQGIEIQVATDPDFTNIVKTATAGKKKTSKKIKGLTSKQTYYVRIRAYKDTAEGKHVSLWKTKKVKVK